MKTLFFFLILCTSYFSFGQNFTTLPAYYFANFQNNPATAGILTDIDLSYRKQWLGISESPENQELNIQTLATNHAGLGLNISKLSYGAVQQKSFSFSYAYHSTWRKSLYKHREHKFALGLSSSLSNWTLDKSRLVFENPQEPLLLSIPNQYIPEIRAGFYLYNSNYFIGVSTLKKISLLSSEQSFVSNTMQINLMGGYTIKTSKTIDYEPSLLIQKSNSTKVEFISRLDFKKDDAVYFWLAGSIGTFVSKGYSKVPTFAAMCGLYLFSNVYTTYTFEYSPSNLSSYSFGNHQITVGFTFNREVGKRCRAY